MIKLLSLFLIASCASHRDPSSRLKPSKISLLQEVKKIECRPIEGDRSIKYLKMDEKDRNLFLKIRNKEKELHYTDLRFMDQSVLMKSSEDHLLFHHREDGNVFVIRGELIKFRESDCEQIEAHKLCKLELKEKKEKILWAPEQLTISGQRKKIVRRYGHFTNDATYSYATDDRNVTKGEANFLIDYGSQLNLLVGRMSHFHCIYP